VAAWLNRDDRVSQCVRRRRLSRIPGDRCELNLLLRFNLELDSDMN
jgi:hypothetical protein